jgi:hypothetical protein
MTLLAGCKRRRSRARKPLIRSRISALGAGLLTPPTPPTVGLQLSNSALGAGLRPALGAGQRSAPVS